MRSQRGFTLIELLVVIAIIAILASILFPVFAKAREKARQTTCTSNVRQLSTAVQMYNQDNQSRFPGKNWADAVLTYVGSQKIYFCPSDAGVDKTQPISYGYNGLLVRTDGTGCNEAQISAPTEVGAICDATPSRPFSDGGALIGGGAMVTTTDNLVGTPYPRHTGVVVGYCDGHAKYFPGKKPDFKDINNPISRAFYQVLSYGMISNYGGAQQALATAPTPGSTTVYLGGDYPGMPLALAAADVWAQLGGKWFTRNFTGSLDTASRARARSGEYVWMYADGTGPGAVANATTEFVAWDALVFIVSKNTKLTAVTTFNTPLNTAGDAAYALTTATISNLFLNSSGFVDPADPLNAGSARVAYVYNSYAGNNTYMQNVVSITIPSILTGYKGTVVADDQEMVEKVAGDPYGIGYCSAAFADPDKVRILDIIPSGGGTAMHFPNNNPKYASTFPSAHNVSTSYPYIRQIMAEYRNAGGTGDSGKLKGIMVDANFQLCPLFMTGYWAQ